MIVMSGPRNLYRAWSVTGEINRLRCAELIQSGERNIQGIVEEVTSFVLYIETIWGQYHITRKGVPCASERKHLPKVFLVIQESCRGKLCDTYVKLPQRLKGVQIVVSR